MKSEKETLPEILFFDGVCHLCNRFVDFMIQNETPSQKENPQLVYAPLQGETAKKHLPPEDLEKLTSVLLFKNGKVYRETEALAELAAHLRWPWRPLFSSVLFFPRPVRQKIYRLIAENRYRIAGKRESCRLPTKDERRKLWI